MSPKQKQTHEKMVADGWHLDTHSTILSRRHSHHKRVGNLQYVKPRPVTRSGKVKQHMDAIFEEIRDQHATGRISHKELMDEILPAYQDLEFELQVNKLL